MREVNANMSKQDVIEIEGEVVEALPNAQFRCGCPAGMSSWRISPASCA